MFDPIPLSFRLLCFNIFYVYAWVCVLLTCKINCWTSLFVPPVINRVWNVLWVFWWLVAGPRWAARCFHGSEFDRKCGRLRCEISSGWRSGWLSTCGCNHVLIYTDISACIYLSIVINWLQLLTTAFTNTSPTTSTTTTYHWYFCYTCTWPKFEVENLNTQVTYMYCISSVWYLSKGQQCMHYCHLHFTFSILF